tara:strand:- start:33 stop:719 length:687 start_codon:yes stop_codon:yes gene_type:complete
MFSIVVPIFNESENIKFLLEEISKSLNRYKSYEIVIVNDASTDNSLKILRSKNYKFLKIINNNINKGQSYSIRKGIENTSNKIIITIDGDGQNDPADIPKLLEIYNSSNKIKLIGGIRTKRKDKYIKVISSKLANFIRSKILDDQCKDTGCSLKIFDKDIFLNFPYFNGIHRFLPALFKGYGYTTKFVEVNHRKRKYGVSKYGTMNRLFVGIRDIFKVMKIIKNKNLI